jgi:zinc/manganese transport system substrate-binding protein
MTRASRRSLVRGLAATIAAAASTAIVMMALAATSGAAFAKDASRQGAGPSTVSAVPVVATFSILADLVARVGGDAVVVTSLVPPGADVHVFRPGPNHAKQIAAAALVVANGLDFEGWMERLVRSSGYRGPVMVASAGIEPLRLAGGHVHGKLAEGHGSKPGQHDDRDHGAGAGARAVDPHAWQSVPNAQRYVANIADALCRARAEACSAFRDNARRYSAMLDALDREIRDTLAAVPPERRKVVTSHAAFSYFGREYGVRFLAPVGASTDAEPSAAAVSRLIRLIRAEGVRAYFIEGTSDARLLARIREETGGAEAGRLYSDSLSAADGPAPTYEAMMRFNARAIRSAL